MTGVRRSKRLAENGFDRYGWKIGEPAKGGFVTIFRIVTKCRSLAFMQSSHFSVVKRVMDRMTALKDPRDIRLVLASVTQDLVEQAGMTVSVIWLYTTDDRCPICQAAGQTGAHI